MPSLYLFLNLHKGNKDGGRVVQCKKVDLKVELLDLSKYGHDFFPLCCHCLSYTNKMLYIVWLLLGRKHMNFLITFL